MKQTDDSISAILHQLLSLGEAMLANGAEVNRVEDTLSRMGMAYGAQRMDILVITTSIIATMICPDGQELTQTRRLTPGGTDFTKLEALNALSRRCCCKPLPIPQLEREIQAICQNDLPRRILYLGSIVTTFSFTILFGGNFFDAVTSALFALLICWLQEYLAPICPNKVIFNLLSALISGLGICAAVWAFPILHLDKVMIGDIMLLIPGMAMTTSVRDVLVGDTISGMMRLIETILWATALALGFVMAIWLTGG